MSAVYAFFVAVFVYKDMTLAKVPKVLLDSANMSAMLLYIITNAVMFSYLMTSEQIPQELAAWMLDKGLGVIAFLLFVNVVLLLAGNVMEPSSIVLIMAPILFPVAMKLGIDPIHFGIMMVVNMEVGMCHPPVGLNLYVASGITKMGITELTDRRLAVAADDAGVPGRRHLLADADALAAADARDDSLALARRRPARTPRGVGARALRQGGPRARLFRSGRGALRADPEIPRQAPPGTAGFAGLHRTPGDRARATRRPKDGIILNLFAFIQPESQAWPSNVPFPSSSPMRLPPISSERSIRASRPTVSRSSPRRCAGCRRRRPAAFTQFTSNGRFSRIWSIS